MLKHEDERWTAVLAHDPAQDGKFFYAVKTTGIYCRPSCPSRRPGRETVVFFDDPTSAERAGYRACRRCKPGEVSAQIAMVERACGFIRRRIDERTTLEEIARDCGVSRFHLQRTFKRITGTSPRGYQEMERMKMFKQELRNSASVTDAIYASGFGSSSRVYEKTDKHLGMTPARYKEQGMGAEIRFSVLDSEMGKLLIAATAKGVCSLRMGDDESVLTAELKAEFPAAKITRDGESLKQYVHAVQEYLAGRASTPTLSLDVKATAFQARVWQALKSIPAGETRSYSEIASELGDPRAVRAVARACAANPVALAVPCHRVVGKSGNLSGYRWGLKRKAKLLEMEGNRGR